MPRSVVVSAARAARRPTAAALRAGSALALSEAEDMFLDDLADMAEVEEAVAKAAKRMPKLGTRYVSAAGVEALVNKAKANFIEAHGGVLPWNLDCRSGGDFGGTGLNYGPGDLGRYGRRMFEVEAEEVLGAWARFAGWLNAITAGCDATARMIKKTQGAGMGAKATKFNLWDMQRRWPSPGKLERMVRAVRDRANAILTAYAGQPRVSNKGIALALMSERTVGKAAVMAVAVTFGLDARNYRTAREALVDLHLNHPVVRKDDGISSRIGREPVLVQGDIAVYAAKFSGEGRLSLDRSGWLVVAGNRSFHVQHGRWDEVSAETAISQARKGWRERHHSSENERLAGYLNGLMTGVCPLISRTDAYWAKNSKDATEEMFLQHGWGNKTFIGGADIIPHLDEWPVKLLIYAAMRRREFYAKAAA